MPNPYTLPLPNIRAAYRPDPGYALVEADLARADAQVIAWEADASKLKEALRHDTDIHSANAIALFASSFERGHPHQVRPLDPRSMHSNGMSYRDCAKRWVHATNFGGRARTLASVLVLAERQIEQCQRWWLEVEHPQIGAFHRLLNSDLASRKNPVIYNRFGFRRLYVGGDRQGNLLGQALAWIAQSTVAVVINTAMLQIDCSADLLHQERCRQCMVCESWPLQLLLQVHDSVLLQVPLSALTNEFIARLTSAMRVTVPYDDPLIIASEIKWSSRSWGHMHSWRGSTKEEAA